MELTLAKIVVVPNKNTLPKGYEDYYVPDHDMYLFCSEATYDTTSCCYSGVLELHDIILRKHKLSHLEDNQFNLVSIDLDRITHSRTVLRSNRRKAPLSTEQLAYIRKLFDVCI